MILLRQVRVPTSSGKGGTAMSLWLKLNALETGTEVCCRITVSITGRVAQFGARMIEAVNNKMFEHYQQFYKHDGAGKWR